MRFLLILSFVLFSIVSFYLLDNSPILTFTGNLESIKNRIAGVFFVASTSEEELKTKYGVAENGGGKIRILVVPGHDDSSVGAQFKNVKEADLTVELAEYLIAFLGEKKEFGILTTRTRAGYVSEIASYFEKESLSIQDFRNEYFQYMKSAVDAGFVARRDGVPHNYATQEGAIRLYGINKWANENNIDIVLHIHFNDQADRFKNQPGEYSGFAIYIPEKQYSNSEASAAIAEYIFDRFETYAATSDMPKESAGIVEEQDLIAIGSNNSLDPAGMLIEYDYIYQPQFLYPETRRAILKELAFQTYSGIKDFFEGNETNAAKNPETTLLPYKWNSDMREGFVGNADVLSLQAMLMREGDYPPPGFTRNDCPITGIFGKCTSAAVKEFQQKSGIEPTGYVGVQTRKILNRDHVVQE